MFMIMNFKCKETQNIFLGHYSKKFPKTIQRVALRKLLMIDASVSINDLRIPPANHLEKLSGKRLGQHSIRINKQWRICFKWNNGNPQNVEIVDYH